MNLNTIKKIHINDWVRLPDDCRAMIGGFPYVKSREDYEPVEILH